METAERPVLTPPHAGPRAAGTTPDVAPATAGSDGELPALADGVAANLLAWYARQRRDLPWRQQPDPYGVLVSEFMLQQTQAERVAPRYLAFRQQFPDFPALASASRAAVLRAWSGLGYNMRALRLQATARAVTARYGGRLPSGEEELRQLPGIGRYTAAAVACFAFGRQVATVDTNIRRVLQRLAVGGAGAPRLTEARLWQLARQALPVGRAADWNQALMDLGATICTARSPACPACPLEEQCRARREERETGAAIAGTAPEPQARRQGPFAGSSRYYRGRIVRLLAELPAGGALPLAALGAQIKEDFAPYEAGWLHSVVSSLARDGLVRLGEEGDQPTVGLPEGEQ